MKPAVPGEVIDPRGGFEEDNRRARRRRGVANNALCHARDFEIIEPADKPAFDSLFEEFFYHLDSKRYLSQASPLHDLTLVIQQSR